ncbi:hypothetical protein [Bacillus cereus]|uniref:hypothetical protein n=1 Tax=Bacillus cereus group TaxID=86661 RepID=UPI0005B634AF
MRATPKIDFPFGSKNSTDVYQLAPLGMGVSKGDNPEQSEAIKRVAETMFCTHIKIIIFQFFKLPK